MKKSFTIAVFDGDGIGPEIMAPTLDILELLQNDTSKYRLNFKKVPAGANEYLKSGRALPDQSLEIAKTSDAISDVFVFLFLFIFLFKKWLQKEASA